MKNYLKINLGSKCARYLFPNIEKVTQVHLFHSAHFKTWKVLKVNIPSSFPTGEFLEATPDRVSSRSEQNRCFDCTLRNVNGIQCCRIAIYWTYQIRMAFSFTFGCRFGSQPDRPHSHLGKPGPNKPRPHLW